MPLDIKNWSLQTIKHLLDADRLDLSPEFQRRAVWDDKKRMTLIDSLARKVPISAITVLEKRVERSASYDVIDGKQRISAFKDYVEGTLIPTAAGLREISDEEEQEGKEDAERTYDKKWGDLDRDVQAAFLEYEMPVYIVTGSRASAVRAFKRMNQAPTALNSQELRNAIWKDGKYLHHIKALGDDLDKLSTTTKPLFVVWGLYSKTKHKRMADIQFMSELVALALDGPQEARRTLDDFYSKYDKPKSKDERTLKAAVQSVKQAVSLLYHVIGPSLASHSFDSENTLYPLVGAVCHGKFSQAQVQNKKVRSNLGKALRAFGNQVVQCKNAISQNADTTRFGKSVKEFASSLMVGQTNSKSRRLQRQDILFGLLTEFLKQTNKNQISDKTRELVWGLSPHKKCGRCKKPVEYTDYHCGHIKARAHGGSVDLDNLRIEHKQCNQKSGAR